MSEGSPTSSDESPGTPNNKGGPGVSPLKMPNPQNAIPTTPGTPGTPGTTPGPNPVPQTPTGSAPPPPGPGIVNGMHVEMTVQGQVPPVVAMTGQEPQAMPLDGGAHPHPPPENVPPFVTPGEGSIDVQVNLTAGPGPTIGEES